MLPTEYGGDAGPLADLASKSCICPSIVLSSKGKFGLLIKSDMSSDLLLNYL